MSQLTKKPKPFLKVLVHDLDSNPSLCGLCCGYELTQWRDKQLANHAIRWLPEFALTPSEWTQIDSANSVEMLAAAAERVYQTEKYGKRGEFGELILHIIVRQVHNSIPAISKVFFKSSVDVPVHGFDAVHVVGPVDDMELWLGEAKFYTDPRRAIRDAVKEIEDHLLPDFLRREFLLIEGKIDNSVPHADVLRSLISKQTSLDEVFNRVCIPVLLTYDSDAIANHTACTEEYQRQFEEEVKDVHRSFRVSLSRKKLPADIRVHLFLLPLKKKVTLVKLLHKRLKECQE